MLCNCLLLEKMVVDSCRDLVNFRLTNRSSRLKSLTIKRCLKLNDFELYAENFEILEFTDQLECFMFRHVLKLAEVFFLFF